MRSVDLPSTLTSIAAQAFRSCSTLNTLYCRATTPPTIANSNALSTANLTNIYVPAASVNAYKTATNWSTYASIISAIST